jgi:ribonuclease HI
VISIYADGSSTGRSGGPGGYGWVIVQDETTILAWCYGGSPSTTNNLMEMEGAAEGLEAALDLGLHKVPGLIELVSDSQYTLGMASGTYSASKNLEQVDRLRTLAQKVGCRFRWVRGHNGNQFNEVCDQLAKQGKDENTPAKVLARAARKKAKRGVKRSTPEDSE